MNSGGIGAPGFPTALATTTGPWTVEVDATRVVFGPDVVDTLGEESARLGLRRVVLVTDHGVQVAGHAERARKAIQVRGIEVEVYGSIDANPTASDVARGVAAVSGFRPDGIVALGGGSVLDTAKGINLLLTNGGRMDDYRGYGKASLPMLPSVGIPTTAGTGSEAQSYALVSKDDTREKMACGDPKARFRTVLLDPSLTATLPRPVAAATGIDAAAHAVESFVSRARNPLSQLFAREAWRLLEAGFEASLHEPADLLVRGRMLTGAYLAGLAIEHSMLGAAHATANPLTARHDVPHGVAVGLMLPYVMRFNHDHVEGWYALLHSGTEAERNGVDLLDRVVQLRQAAGVPDRISDLGIPEDEIDTLADDAIAQWTAGFNPREVTRDDLRAIYASAY